MVEGLVETTIIYLSIGMAFWLLSPKTYFSVPRPGVNPNVVLVSNLLLTVSIICLWPFFLIIVALIATKVIRP